MADGQVSVLYDRVKDMAVSFSLRPGERLNEVAISRRMSVSRTPLREALNRLVAEDLLQFRPGEGFFCRPLEAQDIFELYELRRIVESAAVRLAVERGSDYRLAALKVDLQAHGMQTAGQTVRSLTQRDEDFHLGIADLAGNGALKRQLQHINERIRYIRWVDMAARVRTTKAEHMALAEALVSRDATTAQRIIETHVSRRMDEVVSAVKEGVWMIHQQSDTDPFDKILEGLQ